MTPEERVITQIIADASNITLEHAYSVLVALRRSGYEIIKNWSDWGNTNE